MLAQDNNTSNVAYQDEHTRFTIISDGTIRMEWQKDGYPNYFTRIPNAPNWSGIIVRLIDEELDLALWDVSSKLPRCPNMPFPKLKILSKARRLSA
jgi:hypothetical protein